MAKKLNQACVLAIHGGSSSIKFAIYQVAEALEQRLYGKVDRLGLSGANLMFHELGAKPQASRSLAAADHKSAALFLIDWFEAQKAFASVKAVGHRVVHGMTHSEPEQVTPELIDELHRITTPCRVSPSCCRFRDAST
jgi:acetate kinase